MVYILQNKPFVITNPEHLESIVALIHDEFFVLDDVSFSKDEGIVHIPYRRILHNHPGKLVRNWIISKTYEVDVIRSELTFYNVREYTINDRSHIGTYSFNTILYYDGVLTIKCCEDINLRMLVSNVKIENRDLEIKGKARISRSIFWASNNSKVYD